jgi:thiamine biosynthesis lipoprotein ApbE
MRDNNRCCAAVSGDYGACAKERRRKKADASVNRYLAEATRKISTYSDSSYISVHGA